MFDLTAVPPQALIACPPPRVLTFGPYGSGKTHALRTLLALGLEVFIIFTEPGMEVLSDTPPDRLHWAYVPAELTSLDNLFSQAETVNMYSYQALCEMKGAGNKQNYRQYLTFINTLKNFVCDRTGVSYGPVNAFGPDKVLVIDSLSGLNIMVNRNTTGDRPIPQIGEYRVMQEQLESLINAMCMGLKCGFILTAHPDRANDELGQGAIYPGANGSKLSPKLPRFFSDVIWTYREGKDRYWSTMMQGINTKERNLPLQDKLPPDYGPLYTNWFNRLSTHQA